MKLAGKHTEAVVNRILESFQDPETLPKALSLLFIHRKDEVPCRHWSWHNQLLVAMCGTTDARGIRQWNKAGRRIRETYPNVDVMEGLRFGAEDTDSVKEGHALELDEVTILPKEE